MHSRHAILVAATAVVSLPAHAVQLDLQLLNAFTTSTGARNGSAEILDYSAHQNTISSTMAGTSGFGVQVQPVGRWQPGLQGQKRCRGMAQ